MVVVVVVVVVVAVASWFSFKCFLFSPRTSGKSSNLRGSHIFKLRWFNHHHHRQATQGHRGVSRGSFDRSPKAGGEGRGVQDLSG